MFFREIFRSFAQLSIQLSLAKVEGYGVMGLCGLSKLRLIINSNPIIIYGKIHRRFQGVRA